MVLEKVTEIGISEIIPLICERTEKQKFRYDRMKGICVSAMLQSQQCWLPILHEPVKYIEYIKSMERNSDLTRLLLTVKNLVRKIVSQPLNRLTIQPS